MPAPEVREEEVREKNPRQWGDPQRKEVGEVEGVVKRSRDFNTSCQGRD